jgi:hypothetical protein
MRFSNKCGVQLNLRRMDRFIAMIILVVKRVSPSARVAIWNSQKGNAMRETMHATLTAIGCQLHAEYLPTLARPLPRKLKGLIAQLVALEKRGSTERSVEVLQSAIAHPGPRPRSIGVSIGRDANQIG